MAGFRRREFQEQNPSEPYTYAPEYAPADGFCECQREFLQSFLYCTLRISEANAWHNTGAMTQTFADLVRFASDQEHYRELRELYVEEARADAYSDTLLNYGNLKGLYRPAAWIIHQTTGQYSSALYANPDDMLRNNFNYFPKDMQDTLKNCQCRPWELPDRFTNSLPPAEEEMEQADASDESSRKKPEKETQFMKMMRKREEEKQRIQEHFAEPKQFIDQYIKFCNCKYITATFDYVMTSEEVETANMADSLESLVRGTLQLFAVSRNLSKIQDDNVYFTAMALLRQANTRA